MQRDVVTADSTFFTIQGILSALPSNTPQVYFSPVFWVPLKLPLLSQLLYQSLTVCFLKKQLTWSISNTHCISSYYYLTENPFWWCKIKAKFSHWPTRLSGLPFLIADSGYQSTFSSLLPGKQPPLIFPVKNQIKFLIPGNSCMRLSIMVIPLTPSCFCWNN